MHIFMHSSSIMPTCWGLQLVSDFFFYSLHFRFNVLNLVFTLLFMRSEYCLTFVTFCWIFVAFSCFFALLYCVYGRSLEIGSVKRCHVFLLENFIIVQFPNVTHAYKFESFSFYCPELGIDNIVANWIFQYLRSHVHDRDSE